ncbi:hypothetical protein SLEP1_g2948 [Rubroshorea leprosula]|uniref:Uncharacterized protein n=1 Tax=Rubroshorea leprosula TaxID=152421 RepID=A0AAV5HU75_9ROSI|nr:hypothetical protein SLEP1_g2948 [Rubroshorea leprosula]
MQSLSISIHSLPSLLRTTSNETPLSISVSTENTPLQLAKNENLLFETIENQGIRIPFVAAQTLLPFTCITVEKPTEEDSNRRKNSRSLGLFSTFCSYFGFRSILDFSVSDFPSFRYDMWLDIYLLMSLSGWARL